MSGLPVRRVALVLGAVAGLGLVALVLVVANLNGLIAANRERIVAGMSEGFARPVAVEAITVGFHGGIAMELRGLRIADDPAFSKDDFLAADRADVIVRFWPLLHRRVELRRITVRSPHLTIIRAAHGMNVDSLGRKPAPASVPATAPAPAGGGPAAIPAFAVALMNLEAGAVRYVDRTGAKPVETLVEPLDVRLSDLSLTTPVQVEIDATTKSEPPTTLRIHGTMGPVGESPFAADVPIDQHVRLRSAGLEIDDLAIGGSFRRTPAGTPVASVRVTAPQIRAGGVVVSNLDVRVAEVDGTATLEKLGFGVFDGTIAGSGKVVHTGAPAFSFDTAVRGVDVSKALATRSPEVAERFTGRLDGDLTLGGTGGDEAAVRRSLTGKGGIAVHDGVLRGVNVAEDVLTGVTGVGGLVSLVPAHVRDKYPAIFATDDTRFDQLSSSIRIGGERIQVDDFTVAARDYAMRGKGVVTFAQQVDLTASLTASAALTADVDGALKEAKYLNDDQGRLSIPFRLAGQAPNVRPKPDTDFVARVLQKAIVGEGLDRLLGGGKPKDGKGSDGKGGDGKDLLRKGLDRLFR